MRRRQFITLLGGAAAAWPLAARAQQTEQTRRIGVLIGIGQDDLGGQARYAAFLQALQKLGWSEGRNMRIETRWAAADANRLRKHADELVALAPDVILAVGSVSVGQLLQLNRTIPIVFAIVPDPVGAGFVDSLSRPGGNATGFMMFEYSLAAKWMEMLKEVAPSVTRAAILRDAAIPAGIGQFAVIQSVAPSVGVEASAINVHDRAEIESRIGAFARSSNGGLIVTTSALTTIHRDLIIALAARHRLPTIYSERFYVIDGGLISYGPNFANEVRRAAGYVDRILRGEKPGRSARAGADQIRAGDQPARPPRRSASTVPPSLLARADEVIE